MLGRLNGKRIGLRGMGRIWAGAKVGIGNRKIGPGVKELRSKVG